ncbi:MAG TPA: aspartate aminotransferase family protein [Polyangiaceae bacterium]|nr:aspartate aminotransferase family protein [Polyangiaceae bacterium]
MRAARVAAPMGPAPSPGRVQRVKSDAPSGSIVLATAKGAVVVDVDGNRYVDMAAGFGALLLGHGHPSVLRAAALESERLLLALGDVHPSDAKIALMERLAALHPEKDARVVVGQSGADAVTAALKTAVLATGRPAVIAFRGAYHGLSYAPLAVCGLREGYRAPFAAQLNARVTFVEYPADDEARMRALDDARRALRTGEVGAVLVEPILGRGGCVVPPSGFLRALATLARENGALFVADEIWTGLGRSGSMLRAEAEDASPDVVCLGKGLGGGVPVSACIGTEAVMRAWRREPEVVHTSTFAGAPVACAAAIATLDTLSRERLVDRSRELGARFLSALAAELAPVSGVAAVRGAGFMIGIDLGPRPGAATRAQARFLEAGYVVSTGGGGREVVVLTPPLTITEAQLDGFVAKARAALQSLGA